MQKRDIAYFSSQCQTPSQLTGRCFLRCKHRLAINSDGGSSLHCENKLYASENLPRVYNVYANVYKELVFTWLLLLILIV